MTTNWKEVVANMTLEQRRARLADIRAMAEVGNYDWDYDECVCLELAIPEEAETIRKAFAKRVTRRSIS